MIQTRLSLEQRRGHAHKLAGGNSGLQAQRSGSETRDWRASPSLRAVGCPRARGSGAARGTDAAGWRTDPQDRGSVFLFSQARNLARQRASDPHT
ncbi:hypothetical protein AAFF_G00429040 [Aldrovandia affinis]|uniref:Uncharacterized protein n=1 Tax=Aldrovandia affinis TaxID=143900 RepID=A0AAD7S9A4_9TELE|nr:hypothetical protein AAFF_G00429040 [Aldrovandia affinis]